MPISNTQNTPLKQCSFVIPSPTLPLTETAAAFAAQGCRVAYISDDGRFAERWRYADREKTVLRTPDTPEEARAKVLRYRVKRIAFEPLADTVILDFDHEPDKGQDAAANVRKLRERYNLPICPLVKTPRGGWHLYFTKPENVTFPNWTAKHARLPFDGVDIRAAGGLVTLPPSWRPDKPDKKGGAYKWVHWQAIAPTLPAPLVDALTPPPIPETPQGERCDYIGNISTYCERALTYELEAVAFSGEGGRNEQLFKSSAALASIVAAGGLPESETREALYEIAVHIGLVREDGPHGVRATINSGFTAGMRQPRQLPNQGASA